MTTETISQEGLSFEAGNSVPTVERGGRFSISDEVGNEALDLIYSSSSPEMERERYYDGARPTLPSFKDNEEVATTTLEYLAERPVGYDRQPVVGDDGNVYEGFTDYDLALGGKGIASVDFIEMGDGKAEVGTVRVNSQLRRHGLGRRLMRSAVTLMKGHGVTDLYSGNLSEDGLRTRVAVFGADNLTFYFTDQHREEGRQGTPPTNVQEALALLHKLEAERSPELEGYLSTFGVYTDLTKIDDSQWEHPIPAKVESARVTYEDTSLHEST